MTKGNTAGDFGTSKWKEDFYKQESLTRIIDSTDIDDYKFHKIEKSYTVNYDRVGAIVQIKKDGRTLRAIIDFKRGDPTWNQIVDVTFSLGNDCDYYLFVHGDSLNLPDNESSSDDLEDSQRLLDVLLAYRIDAYLVSAERQSNEQDKIMYEYCCDPGQTYSSETFTDKLPSKRVFDEAEFMIFHWGSNSLYTPNTQFKPSEWFVGHGGNLRMGGYVIRDLERFSSWSDRGLFMNAVPESNEAIESLEWLWENKRKELRNAYKDCKIRLYKKNGRASKLSVRILSKAFKEIPHLAFEERDHFGEVVFCEEVSFNEVIEDLFNDMPAMKMAVNS